METETPINELRRPAKENCLIQSNQIKNQQIKHYNERFCIIFRPCGTSLTIVLHDLHIILQYS
jgi:hypothetical protein